MTAFHFHRLGPDDLPMFDVVLDLFGAAFDDPDSYGRNRPRPAYARRLLGNPGFVLLAALRDGAVAGALAAYELMKFEQ